MLRSFSENLMAGLNIIIKKKRRNNFKSVIIFTLLCKLFMSSMVRYPFIFMGENETLAVIFSYFTGSHLFPISQFEWIYNLTSHRYKIYHLSAGPYKKCQNPVQEDTAISLLWDWLYMSSDHTFSLGRNWITLQSVSGSLIYGIHRLSAAVMLMLRLKKSFPLFVS